LIAAAGALMFVIGVAAAQNINIYNLKSGPLKRPSNKKNKAANKQQSNKRIL